MNLLIVGLFVVGVAMLALTMTVLRLHKQKEWRYLAFLSFGVLPFFFTATVLQANLERMKKVDFCGSCHVMETYVESLTYDDDEPLSSVHYRNNYVDQDHACYSCHTSYAMFGGVKAKTNGLRHVWAYMTKADLDSIALYEPYGNGNCLHCHENGERFQKNKKHTKENNFLEKAQSGELSCSKAGCHDLGHYWESKDESDEDDDW